MNSHHFEWGVVMAVGLAVALSSGDAGCVPAEPMRPTVDASMLSGVAPPSTQPDSSDAGQHCRVTMLGAICTDGRL